jgi:hypothetical protein
VTSPAFRMVLSNVWPHLAPQMEYSDLKQPAFVGIGCVANRSFGDRDLQLPVCYFVSAR